MITAADEDAIRQVPTDAWKPGTGQDGSVEDDTDVAEITELMSPAGTGPGACGGAVGAGAPRTHRPSPRDRQTGTTPETRHQHNQ